MNKRQYIEYLIATPNNYTCTNLANHLQGEQAVSHDAVSDYLRRDKLTPRGLWEVVAPLLHDSPEAYLIVDDSVQDKRHSRAIEMVKLQYSGAEGGLVRGIGVVNLLHTSGQADDFYPIDYRVYSPEDDGKTKHQHFQEMVVRAKSDKRLQARTVLFDSWYASADTLKLLVRLEMLFVTTLKSNRLVSLSKESGYVHLQDLDWTPAHLAQGVSVKLKELPFRVHLFKVVAPNGDIEWVITNKPQPTDGETPSGGEATQVPMTTQDVQDVNAVRWQIEQMHRELKQLVGTEKCQCRKARSQRNHLACCYLAWLALKVRAKQVTATLYAAKANLLRDFLMAELRKPTIRAYGVA
jgi:SRSO17 transposase